MTAYPAPKCPVPPDATPTRSFRGRMRWDVIAELVAEKGWTRGAEIGTADGRTSDKVMRLCPALHMIVVDAWAAQAGNGPEDWADWPHEQNEAKTRRAMSRHGDRARIIKGTSADAAAQVGDASLDFVFFDADHGTEAVLRDIAAWRPKLRPGGMLLGHDINWPTVRGAISFPVWIGPNNVWGECE